VPLSAPVRPLFGHFDSATFDTPSRFCHIPTSFLGATEKRVRPERAKRILKKHAQRDKRSASASPTAGGHNQAVETGKDLTMDTNDLQRAKQSFCDLREAIYQLEMVFKCFCENFAELRDRVENLEKCHEQEI
jgi:hypothetical protein